MTLTCVSKFARGRARAIGMWVGALALGLGALSPQPPVARGQSSEPPQTIPGPVGTIKLPPNTFTVALLGLDKRPSRNFKNTDVIMFAVINPDIPAVTLLSVPRDTSVYIPNVGVTKVNQAYAYGGWPLFRQTVAYNFGLRLDNYAMVNFEGLVRAVDVLGGVDVIATCPLKHVFPRDPYYMGGAIVARDYKDTFTGEVWKAGTRVPTTSIVIETPGLYSLDGLRALAFVRARYGIPGGDVDRVRREQRVVRALFAKAKQGDTLLKLPQLFTQMQQYITTDLSLQRILQLAQLADKFSDLNIRSRFLDGGGNIGAALPGNPTGQSYFTDRRDYLEDAINVSLNQRPNDGIPVEVLNGTNDTGFGVAAADRLRELGFRVVDFKPADRPYKESAIVDFTTTAKGNAVPLLTRSFDIDARYVTKDPQKDGPRYRVIVGSDFNTCYFSKSLLASGSDVIPAFDEPDETHEAVPDTIDFIVPLTPIPTPQPTPAPTPAPGVTVTQPITGAVAPGGAVTQPASSGVVVPSVVVQVPGGDLVNVRSGPGLQYPVVDRLGEFATAIAIGRTETGSWLQITIAKGSGWLNSEFTRIAGDPRTLPIAAPSQTPAQSTARVIVPAGDFVNMRTEPSLRAAVAGILRGRQSAPVVGSNRDQTWWQILVGSRRLWVNTGVVAEVGDFSTVPVVAP